MLVNRTIEKNIFWEFDSIIMQNMSRKLLLFCAPTWPNFHVIENRLFTQVQIQVKGSFSCVVRDSKLPSLSVFPK